LTNDFDASPSEYCEKAAVNLADPTNEAPASSSAFQCAEFSQSAEFSKSSYCTVRLTAPELVTWCVAGGGVVEFQSTVLLLRDQKLLFRMRKRFEGSKKHLPTE